MNLNNLASKVSRWFDSSGKDADVVMSSRVRLARNVAGYKFVNMLDPQQRQEILEKLQGAINSADIGEELTTYDLEQITELDRERLVERHLISTHYASKAGKRAAIISESEEFTAMLNEEDHLRIQTFRSGLDLNSLPRETLFSPRSLRQTWPWCDSRVSGRLRRALAPTIPPSQRDGRGF